MNKFTGFAVLAVGCVLLYFGWVDHESVGSSMAASPANKSLWLLALGLIAAITGLFETTRRSH
ncbi:MAG TPA: DUF3185 family protein [Opitutaceae bacterium]|nr:DUF3185 family protein [Opitutaceae bacterium]